MIFILLICTIFYSNSFSINSDIKYSKNNLFTIRDDKEGNIGIGKLPEELQSISDNMAKEYINKISDKSSTTYHTYYNDLMGNLKKNFDKIQYNIFWNDICDNSNNCIKYTITEMNEIYYSNPKPNFEKLNLYGAAANLVPHRDCILYNFNGINFYRIIIGLTDANNDTLTELIYFNLTHKINNGDYIIFDFDKTLHRVKKTGQHETPRILLKLHYIVCENCKYSESYVKFISKFYINYYLIARYTETIGTDPTTFIGFFLGLLWQLAFYLLFKYIIILAFIIIITTLYLFYKVNHIYKLLKYSLFIMFIIYLLIVYFYYCRYILFNIK